MTNPVLPFEVLQVRDDGDGRTVFFEVGKRSIVNNKQTSLVMRSAIFVGYDQDINETLHKALSEQGWIV